MEWTLNKLLALLKGTTISLILEISSLLSSLTSASPFREIRLNLNKMQKQETMDTYSAYDSAHAFKLESNTCTACVEASTKLFPPALKLKW
jgi:hypothetical protein